MQASAVLVAAAYTMALEFVDRHAALKSEFQERCWTLRDIYTGQELAAEFCTLKGAKLDLSKL